MTARRRLLLAGASVPCSALLDGCGGTGDARRPMQLSDFAKSDMDLVAEFHLAANLADLRELMLKLYRRNPRQWKQTGKASAEAVTARLFADPTRLDFPELGGARGTAAVLLAFAPDYTGDRVLAFVGGLLNMLMSAYDNRQQFYMLDELDPQKLFNAARNIEIAVWKLANNRDAAGQPLLLSNSMDEGVANISYERLFGKLIGRQEILAEIVADRTNRTLRHVVQRMASAVFLPI